MSTDYIEHFKLMNAGEQSEDTYRSAKAYYEAEIKNILPNNELNPRILDVGFGYGHFLRYLSEIGYKDISGIDNSEELHKMILVYLSGKTDQLMLADAFEYLRDQQDKFNFISFIDVIEHFSCNEALQILKRSKEALREGGRIVLRTPNMSNILGIYSRYMDLTHRYGYTEFSLKQLLRDAGFTKISVVQPQWVRTNDRLKKWINVLMHKFLFKLQDRVTPTCFEKNIILIADK